MIDNDNLEDLRDAAQICNDVIDEMYFIPDDEDVPAYAQEVEELLGAAYENINEAVSLLKRG